MTALAFSKETNATPRVIDLAGVAVESITVSGCTGLHFINGVLPAPTVARKAMLRVSGSSDITFDNMDVTGDLKAYGLLAADSVGVRITNSRLDRCFQGVNMGRVNDFAVIGCDIVGQNNDGIVVAACRKGAIQFNGISASLRQNAKHPDGIQFVLKDVWSEDITVTDNTIMLKAQGIFGAGLKNCLIARNQIRCTHLRGISFDSRSSGLTVQDNDVRTLLGSTTQCLIAIESVFVGGANRVAAVGRYPARIDAV